MKSHHTEYAYDAHCSVLLQLIAWPVLMGIDTVFTLWPYIRIPLGFINLTLTLPYSYGKTF